jgi:hypothetical protein
MNLREISGKPIPQPIGKSNYINDNTGVKLAFQFQSILADE